MFNCLMSSESSNDISDANQPTKKRTSAILNVYFEGTANTLQSFGTQIGLFSHITQAVDIHINDINNPNTISESNDHYKISYDGCGVTNGINGLIFASGLKDQCCEIIHYAGLLINLYEKLQVNAVGLSRGGIAVLYLAQELSVFNPEVLRLNLLAFDPVPGNLISSGWLDIFGFSTANSAINLTNCNNIDNVLSLYPYEPLPDLAFHAPLLPNYPINCRVEEDACLGCHQGALFCHGNVESRLSYVRIRSWLEEHGTLFNTPKDSYVMHIIASLSLSPQQCLEIMDMQVEKLNRTKQIVLRHAHSSPSGAVIKRHSSGKYLNVWHKYLSTQYTTTTKDSEPFSNYENEYFLAIIR